jgi:4'-phosphopantetheinyl transferase
MYSADDLWHEAPESLNLDGTEVHVWRSGLDRSAPCVKKLRLTLTPDERTRAERFHFQRDCDRFIVSRGTLRAILGRYLHTEPHQLRFCYGNRGKPMLINEQRGDIFRFNVSHSHNLAVFAVTRGREIGIDLEWARPGLDCQQIAERLFSPQEIRVLRALHRDAQDEAFFNCWTRKEAFIKAKGGGLSISLNEFEVSLSPGEPAALLTTMGDPQEAFRWSLRELFPSPGFSAAIAVEGRDWQLKCWQWPE